jgi:hypothetical protein
MTQILIQRHSIDATNSIRRFSSYILNFNNLKAQFLSFVPVMCLTHPVCLFVSLAAPAGYAGVQEACSSAGQALSFTAVATEVPADRY